MSNTTIEALKSVDAFHKNCQLLFDDLVSLIREKTLADHIRDLLGPEGGYCVWNSRESEHKEVYIFEHNEQIRFISMFIKNREENIKKNSDGYKDICRELGIDIIYPFVLVFGVFKVNDRDRFINDRYLKFNWINNTLLIGLPENILAQLSRPSYKLNETIEINMNGEVDSWYCNGAVFKIKSLFNIKDPCNLEEVANELLNI